VGGLLGTELGWELGDSLGNALGGLGIGLRVGLGIGLGVGLGFCMGVSLAINHIRVNHRKVCVRRTVAKISYLDYCCRNRMLTYMKAYLTVSIRLRTHQWDWNPWAWHRQ
jgi:hypothetical protein